jgi:hypothetical protein
LEVNEAFPVIIPQWVAQLVVVKAIIAIAINNFSVFIFNVNLFFAYS